MMFVILCYDVNVKRVGRMRKTALKYLHPVQRSVFEGELTEKSLNRMKRDIAAIIEPETDSVSVYCVPSPNEVTRHQIGECPPDAWIL